MRSLRVSGLWATSLILLSAPGGADAIVPFDWIHRVSLSVQQGVQEQAWLWGWAWGPDSTVSIVDRSPVLTFPSRPAGFGADLADPMLGYVIPLNSFTAPCEEGLMATDDNTTEWNLGCPPLCVTGANVPSEDERWIALVQRGSCQFANKAREAQRLGAKAVVVGGDDPAVSGNPDVLVNMYSPGDSSDITIAATFIRFSDYALLYALIQASNTSHSGLKTLSMLISSEYSPWQWYSPIVTFVTLLFIPSSLAFLTLLVHRIRAARAAQLDRAPVDIVHSLPWRVWTGSAWEKHGGSPESSSTIDVERGEGTAHAVIDDEEDPAWFLSQVECIICLENFAKGDRVRVLPCKHIFHLKEVDEWLIQRKKLCPICKADVTKPTPHAHAANQPPPTTTTTTTDSEPTPQIQSPDLPATSSATERTPLLPPRPNPEP